MNRWLLVALWAIALFATVNLPAAPTEVIPTDSEMSQLYNEYKVMRRTIEDLQKKNEELEA